MAIRFHENDTRPIGRVTEGVRGILLSGADVVVGMVVVRRLGSTLLVVTEKGMGKRTEVDAYRFQRRGGQGVINIKTSAKTGKVVSIMAVTPDEQLMLITRNGVVNRQRVDEIRVIGRATQGVRLVSLDDGDQVVDVARIIPEENGVREVVEELARSEAGEASSGAGAGLGAGAEGVEEDAE